MELNEYQKRAMETCLPTSDNFSYMMLNLVGEVGEFASKVAKAIRKEELAIGTAKEEGDEETYHDNVLVVSHDYTRESLYDNFKELKKEAGDILWQLSGLCKVMGWSLEDIARMNLDKLASRKSRNVIDGNGDNR